jgi:hypothetical protein
MREKGLGAHSDHVGALGDDGEGSEWSGHVRAVMAGLRPDTRKTVAIRARERGSCGEAFCMADGGSTEAAVSGGVAVAVDMEKKKETRR